MMISTKGRYALRVMLDLAGHMEDGYIPLAEIAARQKISEKYLESSNNTVMAHIGRLREKLHEPARRPKFIKTVWGVGYQIED